MELRRLGRTDLSIAPIVFGGNVFGWPADDTLAWLLRKKGVTAPIASATCLGQLDAMINAVKLDLSSDAMALLDYEGA